MEERIASCACGRVRLRLTGRPIIAAVCYCDDCQAGARQLEAAGAPPSFHDPWYGSPYVTMRDDRLAVAEGADRLAGHKLRDDAPTTRYLATCCQTPMYLKHRPGWWTSVYRSALGADAPALEMRSQVQHVADPVDLPTDLPTYRSFPLTLIVRLMAARLAIGWRRAGPPA